MAITFESVYRAVLAHVPIAGPLLCREWVQWAYNEYGTHRSWSHLRVESVITANDQKQGMATATKGSATIAGGTLAFAATDVGRQIRLSSIPIYTIIAVDVTGGTTATINRAYGEVSGLQAFTVLDAYVTMPLDFNRFSAILDPQNKWKLRYWITSDQLNACDPGRMSTGNAAMLVNQAYSPVPGFLGNVRYELYPYQTAARSYPMWYFRKGEILTDDDVFIGQLANRAKDVLVPGALSRAAMWPGVDGKKNMYFDLNLAKIHKAEFDAKMSEMYTADDDLYFEDAPMVNYAYAGFPWDAAWLQSHEPSIIG